MKGKTIIELKDAYGRKQIYEDNNMVTKALEYFLKQGGITNPSAFNVSALRTNAIEMLLGGVLLLDDTLTENVDTIKVPAGIGMVANGAMNITNLSTPTELGSYNDTESGWQQDGTLKMVWDYTTSQGNGTIKCVCLTSKYMGLRGLGNADGKISNVLSIGSYNSPTGMSGYDGSAVGVVGNVLYTVEQIWAGAGGTSNITGVILRKYRIPMTTFDVRDNITSPLLLDEQTLTFTNPVSGSDSSQWETYLNASIDSNYIYMVYHRHWSTSWSNAHEIMWTDSVPLWFRKINLANGQVTEQNITPSSLGLSAYSGVRCPISISNTHILADKYEIELSGYTIDEQVSGLDFSDNYWRVYSQGTEHRWLAVSDNTASYMLDFIDGTCKAVNLANGTEESGFDREVTPLLWSAGNYIQRDPRYVATINNLSAPVTKSGDKTMKVTYILSF